MSTEHKPHSALDRAKEFLGEIEQRPLDYAEGLVHDLVEQFETQRLALLEAVRLLTWYRRGAPGVPPPWEQVDAALLKADEVLNPASRSSE